VRVGKIAIQRQRPLAFGNAPGSAFRQHQCNTQRSVGHGMARGQGQRLGRGRLGGQEARAPIVGHEAASERRINDGRADQRLDIVGIKCQRPLEKAARLRQ
jgi:hypothetical protein